MKDKHDKKEAINLAPGLTNDQRDKLEEKVCSS